MMGFDVQPLPDHERFPIVSNPQLARKKEMPRCSYFSEYPTSNADGHQCERLQNVDRTCEQNDSQQNQCFVELQEHLLVSKYVYTQDQEGDTLLHTAILILNENMAKEFINLSPSPTSLNIRNHLRQTPLHLAVLTKQARVVRRLVVGGADIMSYDREGNTSLHIACRKGYTEIVRTLLEPVRYLETKQNVYDIPYQRIPQDLGKMNFDGFSCLHLAASNRHLDIVKVLLEKFANINLRDLKSGRTLLHHACVDGNIALVKLLLTYKTCNINAQTYNNLTPFDLARDRGHARITFELAAAGAIAADEIDMEGI